MKAGLLGIAVVFFVLVVSGCSTPIACNPPYIVKGSGCCLDQNDNRICDSDEGAGPIGPVKTYGAYKVIMYIQQDSPEPDFWSRLPPSPARNFDGYQIYSSLVNESYYDAGWLLLYTSYTEESITCSIDEYRDSAFYSQYSVKLTKKGYAEDVNGVALRVIFKKDSTPKNVRYDYRCHGDESGITFQDAYALGLRPP